MKFSYNLNVLKHTIECLQFDILVIEDCPSVADAINSLSTANYLAKRAITNSIGIILRINEDFNESDVDLGKSLSTIFKDAPRLLIAVESTISDKCMVFWKIMDKKDFLWLNLMQNSNGDLNEFIIKFLVKELQSENNGKKIYNILIFYLR